jgi:hypothetical protein
VPQTLGAPNADAFSRRARIVPERAPRVLQTLFRESLHQLPGLRAALAGAAIFHGFPAGTKAEIDKRDKEWKRSVHDIEDFLGLWLLFINVAFPPD